MSGSSLVQSFLVQPFDVVRPDGRDNRDNRNQPSIHALGIADDITLTDTRAKKDRLKAQRVSVAAQVSSLLNLITNNEDYKLTTADENLLHLYGDLYAHDLHGLPFTEGTGHLLPGAKQDNPGYKYSKENFKKYAEQLRYFSSMSNNGFGGKPSAEYTELLNKIALTKDQEVQIRLLMDFAKSEHDVDKVNPPKPGHPIGR